MVNIPKDYKCPICGTITCKQKRIYSARVHLTYMKPPIDGVEPNEVYM